MQREDFEAQVVPFAGCPSAVFATAIAPPAINAVEAIATTIVAREVLNDRPREI